MILLVTAPLVIIEPVRATTWPGRNGKIAFMRNAGGRLSPPRDKDGVVVMRKDGSGLLRLTWRWGLPSWSPDGKRLSVLQYAKDGVTAKIIVMHPDGSDRVVVSQPAQGDGEWAGCMLQPPSWSPDGELLAYVDDCFDQVPRVGQLRIVRADGTEHAALTDYSFAQHFGSWSPDGSEMAILNNSDGDLEIYLTEVDGTNVRQLTDDDDYQEGAKFSPDGTRIAFITESSSGSTATSELVMMSTDGTDRVVMAGGQLGSAAWWSPDGRFISFFRYGRPGVRILEPSRAHEFAVGQDLSSIESVSWAPNSRALLITRDGDIWRVSLEGRKRQLTTNAAYDMHPTWQARPQL